jgi:hypothetical protein
LGVFLYCTDRLPRFFMDVLDRLTDRGALERSYEQKQATLTVIDAEALAARLKAKVVGQSDVLTLSRASYAGESPPGARTSRSQCFVSPDLPESARPISPR